MNRLADLLRRAVVPVLAVVTAFILGAIALVLTDTDHLQHIGTDPVGALGAATGTMANAYGALLAGAIGDPGRIVTAIQSGDPADIAAAIRPVTESLLTAAPFIFVCLGLAIAFHSGPCNLGADGHLLGRPCWRPEPPDGL